MRREDILHQAESCICGDRDRDYGSPNGSFGLIAKLWSAYMDIEFTAKDVAILMALLKVARCKYSSKEDNFVDGAGYFACAGEVALGRDKENNVSSLTQSQIDLKKEIMDKIEEE